MLYEVDKAAQYNILLPDPALVNPIDSLRALQNQRRHSQIKSLESPSRYLRDRIDLINAYLVPIYVAIDDMEPSLAFQSRLEYHLALRGAAGYFEHDNITPLTTRQHIYKLDIDENLVAIKALTRAHGLAALTNDTAA